MKTILIALSLLVPSVSMASIDTNLKYGQSGSSVSELQDFLVDNGFLHTNPTGFFGVLTLKAVKEYQISVDVPSTGYVGVLTRGKINSELNEVVASSTTAELEETGTTTPVVYKPETIAPKQVINNPQPMPEVVLGTISEIKEVPTVSPTQTKRYVVNVTKGDAKTVLVETTSTAYNYTKRNLIGDDSFFFTSPEDNGTVTIKATYYSDFARAEGGQMVYPSQVIGEKEYSFTIK